jgi:hypothetical protein
VRQPTAQTTHPRDRVTACPGHALPLHPRHLRALQAMPAISPCWSATKARRPRAAWRWTGCAPPLVDHHHRRPDAELPAFRFEDFSAASFIRYST